MDRHIRFNRTKKEQQFANKFSSYNDMRSFVKNPKFWIHKNTLMTGLGLEMHEYDTDLKKRVIQEEFEEMIQSNFPSLKEASALVGTVIDSLDWNKTFFFECMESLSVKDKGKAIDRLTKEILTEEELSSYVKDYPTFVELTQKINLDFALKHELNIDTILIHNEEMNENDKEPFVKYHKLKSMFTS